MHCGESNAVVVKSSKIIVRWVIQAALCVSMKVLVVDDNRDAASTLSMLVEMVGHEVRTAFDGIEALVEAARFLPDVVLLDLGMPRMDGFEACRQMRAQPWGVKMAVIAVTGWGNEADRLRTKQVGFDHHLVKPVEPDVILSTLDSLERQAGP